jgi:HAD superfamily hydrolase (TIGR01509 family)
MGFKAIIFDIDGTLVDAIETYQLAFNIGVARFGLQPVRAADLAQKLYNGLTLDRIIISFYPDRSDPSFLRICGEAVLAAFRELPDEQTPLLPGARQVLEAISSRGITMAVATGRTEPSKKVREWLGKIGIGHHFRAVVTAADVVARKPAPDCILECARQLGITASDCLVVGDSTTDIGAAKAAGAGVVSVSTGVSSHQALLELEPLVVLSNLGGLTDFLGLNKDSLETAESARRPE